MVIMWIGFCQTFSNVWEGTTQLHVPVILDRHILCKFCFVLLLPDNERLFHDYLKKINSNLAYVQFELRAFRNQYDGTVYYGVVNNVADEQSKLGTKYSVPQIAFYKGIVSVGPPLLCLSFSLYDNFFIFLFFFKLGLDTMLLIVVLTFFFSWLNLQGGGI